MTTGGTTASGPAIVEGTTCLVLLCGRLAERLPALRLEELRVWISDRLDGAIAVVEDDVCGNAEVVGDILEAGDAQRLVLGLCSNGYSEIELLAQVRKAGIDPLGVRTVDIERFWHADIAAEHATSATRISLSAAVAGALAFAGSNPENIKTVLASADHKVTRRNLFTLPPITYKTVPTIDRSKCKASEGCSVCVTACPYGALAQDDEFVLVGRSLCQSCGICVGACPQRAVEFPGSSPDEIEAELSTILSMADGLEQHSIGFRCKSAGIPHEPGRLTLTVPCVSMLPATAILTALDRAASTVVLEGCGSECPKGQWETVEGRAAYCQQLLGQMGDPHYSSRVRTLSPEEPSADIPESPTLPGEPANGFPTVFGSEAAARVVMGLAGRLGADELVLQHPQSPLGIVSIDGDACTGCGTCAQVCPTDALQVEPDGVGMQITFDPQQCVACGACTKLCPEAERDAINHDRMTDLTSLNAGRTTVYRDVQALCEKCGEPIAPTRMLDRISAILGDENPTLVAQLGRFCSNCR